MMNLFEVRSGKIAKPNCKDAMVGKSNLIMVTSDQIKSGRCKAYKYLI